MKIRQINIIIRTYLYNVYLILLYKHLTIQVISLNNISILIYLSEMKKEVT